MIFKNLSMSIYLSLSNLPSSTCTYADFYIHNYFIFPNSYDNVRTSKELALFLEPPLLILSTGDQ